MRGRDHGYVTTLDLSKWFDRQTYFLGRWHALGIESFVSSVCGLPDTIVDVGANRGEFSLFASSVVKGGKVICFDPNPQCLAKLRGDILRNSITNIEIHQVGLSSESGSMMLHVPRIYSGQASFGPMDDFDIEYEVKAELKRGDDVLANENPALIKIDVEGFECHAIEGLSQTIRRCRPLVITEVDRKNLTRCGTSTEELIELMGGLGYKGARLLTRHHSYALGEFDFYSSFL